MTKYSNLVFPKESILSEIANFEDFFELFGLRRIDGAIYGLLTLSKTPLSSEEIQDILQFSQSSISTSLKNLKHFGIIETRLGNGKAKIHSTSEDSLQIVATIFRKREQQAIENFRKTAIRLNTMIDSQDESNLNVRNKLASIAGTSEIAESVINFVIQLSEIRETFIRKEISEKLPKVLDFLTKSTEAFSNVSQNKNTLLSEILKKGVTKLQEKGNELLKDY